MVAGEPLVERDARGIAAYRFQRSTDERIY